MKELDQRGDTHKLLGLKNGIRLSILLIEIDIKILLTGQLPQAPRLEVENRIKISEIELRCPI